MFDGYVFVDQLPENDSNEPAIYIYTRPFDLSSVKLRDSLSIYTTAVLRSVMIYDKNSNVRDSIKIINISDVSLSIELPNRETVWIKTFSCNSKTLNIVVLFEYCDRYTLYAGRFIASNSELFQDQRANKGLRELMQRKKIDDLYIDLTMANIDEFNLQRTALHEIESLVKSNKLHGYKFHMLVEDFGYEDLIFKLAQEGITICLDDKRIEIFKRLDSLHFFHMNKNTAQIRLVDQFPSDIQGHFEKEKVICIKLDPEPTEKSSESLRIIKFSIHPTMPDIQYIANIAAPLHIYPIGETVKTPFDLNYLCRYDDNCDKENRSNGFSLH